MNHSPAEIAAQYLTDKNVFADWPLFISHMPAKPSRACVVYNTAIVDDKHSTIKQGISIQIRGKRTDSDVLRLKLDEALTALNVAKHEAVYLDSSVYYISAVLASGPVSLGVLDEKQREIWSMNLIMTVRSV